ncbi:hypothetical protein [Magnetospirillum sp. UT-4]|uniref:hypothetical protein n=1 Tax=Magnetospirillum sp. UT-4 TaxID=2681467 RepID=UPI00137C6B2E|nr:hypothetical protein [Magnetospirillum sp. UT-4]CAA7625676.1 hypothetical protein MTBUT4_70072 [Magnetospirillum sp. UT-4]
MSAQATLSAIDALILGGAMIGLVVFAVLVVALRFRSFRSRRARMERAPRDDTGDSPPFSEHAVEAIAERVADRVVRRLGDHIENLSADYQTILKPGSLEPRPQPAVGRSFIPLKESNQNHPSPAGLLTDKHNVADQRTN